MIINLCILLTLSIKNGDTGKRPTESEAEMIVMMLPSDANPKGNVFGGVILKHVDLIAGLVAKRHSGRANVVTASIDRMVFLKPVFIGNALIISARITYVRRSSMEIEVNVEAEDLDDNSTGTCCDRVRNYGSLRQVWKTHKDSPLNYG